jgi:predicted O-linked N-acetylglucosamine transferase (SPINDLY family)
MTPPFTKHRDSSEALACHHRGLELLESQQAPLAIAELERAVALEPGNAEFLKSLGNAQKAAGKLDDAIASYRRSLDITPDYLPSLYNLAVTLRETGNAGEAEQRFRRLRELEPNDVDTLFHLGGLLAARSQFVESAAVYRDALRLTPDNPYLWLALGRVTQGMPGQLEESIRCLQKAIELYPDLADAHYGLGLARSKLGMIGAAVASYRRALELEPNAVNTLNDLGNILQDEGRLDEAIALYRRALAVSPDYAAVHCNLGNALLRQDRLDDAIASYRQAVQLQPEFVLAHFNLGNAFSLKGQRDEATRCFATVLELEPGHVAAADSLLFEMRQACDWSRFDELCELVLRSVRERREQQIGPFGLLSIASSPDEQLQCARHFAERQLAAVARDRERLQFGFDRSPRSKLRIGYLSADLHEHATAYLMAELFELHDRNRFEIVAYSYGPDDATPMRTRLKGGFDSFVNVAALPHADAAARIHDDRIDILVDLKGYTTDSRPEIVALRPAAIQVSYIGYPGTMGAEFIDYAVVDYFLAPPGADAHYTEKLVRLPGSYQVNDRKRVVASTPARSDLGLPEGAFVFCCFNQAYKILPRVFEIWTRLVAAVPGSVLWLLDPGATAARNLRSELGRRGIDPERLIVAPKLPLARHLGRLRAADLFLDTFPYNAHTTTSDALWVGLPVLTCKGDTFASRVAGSLLSAAGMTELITSSLEAYEACALRLARNTPELIALREKLSRGRDTAPLFDTPLFARHLEAAYLRMWEIYLRGEPPRAIDV